MENTTPATHTLFGFDRLARAMHRGSSGIKTGSNGPRPGGMTHLFDRATGRTACGRLPGRMAVTLVPASVTEDSYTKRVALCTKCAAHTH